MTKQFMTGGSLASNNYQALTLGNTTTVMPTGLYSDKAFNNTLHFSAPKNTTNDVSEGSWLINADAFDSYMKDAQKAIGEGDNAFYEKMVAALGFNQSAKSGQWYGRSTDGLHWTGEMSAANNAIVWAESKLAPDVFYGGLSNAVRKIGAPTEEQLKKIQEQAKTPEEKQKFDYSYFYTVQPRESIIAQFFAISDSTRTAGSMTDPKTGKAVKAVTTKDKNTIQFVVNPNVWVNAFLHPASTDILMLVDYNKATLTFFKNNPARLDVTLTPSE
jgi:hypothetical protein